MNKIIQKVASLVIGLSTIVFGIWFKRTKITKWVTTPILIASFLIGGFFLSRTFYDEPLVFAAVAKGTTTAAVGNSGPTFTVSSHVVSGTDTIIVVTSAMRSNNNITGITWNGTEDFSIASVDANSDAVAEMWYLVNPTGGTFDVVVTYDGNNRVVVGATTFTGVDQTKPFSATSTANGADDAPTVNITGNNDDLIVDGLAQTSHGPDTATAAHTELYNLAQTGGGTDERGASQTLAADGTSQTMSWAMSDSDSWALVAGALQPSGDAAGTGGLPSWYQKGDSFIKGDAFNK